MNTEEVKLNFHFMHFIHYSDIVIDKRLNCFKSISLQVIVVVFIVLYEVILISLHYTTTLRCIDHWKLTTRSERHFRVIQVSLDR